MHSILIEGKVILNALQADEPSDFDVLWQVLQSGVRGYITQDDLDWLFVSITRSQGLESATQIVHHLRQSLTIWDRDAPSLDYRISTQSLLFDLAANDELVVSVSEYLERLSLDIIVGQQPELLKNKPHQALMHWYRKAAGHGFDSILVIPFAIAILMQSLGLFDKIWSQQPQQLNLVATDPTQSQTSWQDLKDLVTVSPVQDLPPSLTESRVDLHGETSPSSTDSWAIAPTSEDSIPLEASRSSDDRMAALLTEENYGLSLFSQTLFQEGILRSNTPATVPSVPPDSDATRTRTDAPETTTIVKTVDPSPKLLSVAQQDKPESDPSPTEHTLIDPSPFPPKDNFQITDVDDENSVPIESEGETSFPKTEEVESSSPENQKKDAQDDEFNSSDGLAPDGLKKDSANSPDYQDAIDATLDWNSKTESNLDLMVPTTWGLDSDQVKLSQDDVSYLLEDTTLGSVSPILGNSSELDWTESTETIFGSIIDNHNSL